jgi:hypothetical protein
VIDLEAGKYDVTWFSLPDRDIWMQKDERFSVVVWLPERQVSKRS